MFVECVKLLKAQPVQDVQLMDWEHLHVSTTSTDGFAAMHIKYCTELLDLWQLCEIDEKQYNRGPLDDCLHHIAPC